jgi:predicted nucleic acid-binding protein
METVFLDSVGMLALWNRRDQWHAVAAKAFKPLVTTPSRFVTTTLVLYECGNAAARLSFRGQVVKTYRSMINTGAVILPTDADIEEGWKNYDRDGRGAAGIVDQISFAVMRRLGLMRAFTNDKHFSAAGFQVLF